MKKIYLLIIVCVTWLTACEDLAFGDKFLQKPPSNDVTIDTVFSTAEYARRVLWYSYNKLPYGLQTPNYITAMRVGSMEGLTDLAHTYAANSGEKGIYYPGVYDASCENKGSTKTKATKYRFYEFGAWEGIRHAWLFYENVDKVPDMSQEEKLRMKAEAKTLVAVFYSDMFRHYGALPILTHSLQADELKFPERADLQQTLDFIVGLLDDAIGCAEFPWTLPVDERNNWDGRLTKASAMGLKVRLLLFAASPLFNSEAPYYAGEASDKLMTWFGGYSEERWRNVVKAGEAFFQMMEREGFYHLVQKEDTRTGTYRQAFQDAYYTRGTTESLISSRRGYYTTNNLASLDQAIRWGGFNPTKELFDMFQMADGSDFDWNNPEHSKNPFINRDPRLSETIILDGDAFQGGKAQVYQKDPQDAKNWPDGKDWNKNNVTGGSITNGICARKFGLDRKGEFKNRVFHWSHLRLAEIYLSHAEALNQLGTTDALGRDALYYVNKVRNRVGMGDLKNISGKDLLEAILRERACEFCWEEVRFFDLIRWKREADFTKPLHGLNIYKNKNTGEYKFKVWELEQRAWQKPGGFSSKWYLSAFPSDEINKNYGLQQNPGW